MLQMLAGRYRRFEPWSRWRLTLSQTLGLMLLVSLNPVPVDDAKSNSHQWFEERGQLERRGSPSRGELGKLEEMSD